MKMTFQQRRSLAVEFMVFRREMQTSNGRKVLANRSQKEDISYLHRSHLCGLFFYHNFLFIEGLLH